MQRNIWIDSGGESYPLRKLRRSDLDEAMSSLAFSQLKLMLEDAKSSNSEILADVCDFVFGSDRNMLENYCGVLINDVEAGVIAELIGMNVNDAALASLGERQKLFADAVGIKVASLILEGAASRSREGHLAAQAWCEGETDGVFYIPSFTFRELENVATQHFARCH